jgi:hypothetical protein
MYGGDKVSIYDTDEIILVIIAYLVDKCLQTAPNPPGYVSMHQSLLESMPLISMPVVQSSFTKEKIGHDSTLPS